MPLQLHARRCAAAVALLVLVAVAGLGLAMHREPRLAVPAAEAERLGAADPAIAAVAGRATRVEVLHIDDHLTKVVWYDGGRRLAAVGVQRDGSLFQPKVDDDGRIGYGAPLTHETFVVAALVALFLLATLRRPLRSRHTAGVALIAAFVFPTLLLDRARSASGELAAALLLLLVVVAGILTAVGGRTREDDVHAPVLLQLLAQRLRAPRLPVQLGAALLAATVLVVIASADIVDVAQANMEGATLVLQGLLPYGHMPGDVVHGDTYGLPMYLVYAPVAAIWPMHSTWDDPLGSLVVGAVALLVLAAGVERATRGERWPTAIALVTMPAAVMSLSSGTNDVLLAASLVWTLAWFARPAASSALLTLAGAAKVAPLVLLPIWLARLRGAELVRALAACAAVGAAILAALVALGGLSGPLDMAHAMAFQLERQSELSVWTVLDAPLLQALAQGMTAAVALGGAVLVALDRGVSTDPRRVAALITAVLAGLQLAANHWMPLYVLWLLPPAMVAFLGPLGATAPAAARSRSVSAGRPSRAECPSSATPSWARQPVPSSLPPAS